MTKKIESTPFVKRYFPEVFKSNSRYYVFAAEDTNIIYLEQHEIEILSNTEEHIKTVRIFCSLGDETKLLREWNRGTSIFTSIYTP